MHFQGLRNKAAAQKEIRDIAQTMRALVQAIDGEPFKYTLLAFDNANL